MIPALDYRLPTNAVLNVKSYGVTGDGVTDDTVALQNAHNDAAQKNYYLFYPKGTYLISDRIWPKKASGLPSHNFKIFGENRDQTIIKLKDGSAGFQDPNVPKSMLMWNSDSTSSNPQPTYPTLGEGNEAYGNYCEHVTVDCGNNPGCNTIDYLGNNGGAIRDVLVKGNGLCGISMLRNWPGPSIVKDVRVEGHKYAFQFERSQYSVILEDVEIANQTVCGITLGRQVIGIRHMKSTNSVPVLQMITTGNCAATIVDSEFTGGSSANVAMEVFWGEAFFRNVTTSGYSSAIKFRGNAVPGANVTEWTSRASDKTFAEAPVTSLNLPWEETPAEYINNDFTQWANVADYGAFPGSGGAHVGIQAALNSGKPVVYFPGPPNGALYYIGQTLVVPPTVKKVMFFHAQLFPMAASGYTNAASPKVMMRAENTQTLELNRGRMAAWTEIVPGLVTFEQAGTGPVVLRDMNISSREMISPAIRTAPDKTNVGTLFIENFVGGRLQFLQKGHKFYARQLNIEGPKLMLEVEGAQCLILGYKTEGAGPFLSLKKQGKLELLAGFFYVTATPAPGPAFSLNYSTASLNFVEAADSVSGSWPILVEETSYASGSSSTRSLQASTLPSRGFGRYLPLYTSVNNGDNPPPAQYALIFPQPIDMDVAAESALVKYEVLFVSPDKRDRSFITVTLAPGDTQASTQSKLQAALVAEATRLNMTLTPANMLMPAMAKGV